MILITQEMFEVAQQEVGRRNQYLNPHFNLRYLDESSRQMIGFLGEFACQEYLGLDWIRNIRENYLVADDYDFIYNNFRIDVKTETIPRQETLEQVVQRTIDDNVPYGRRLIHENQYRNNLPNYDFVAFGCMLRPNGIDWHPVGQYWYPIGSASSEFILQNYQPTLATPFGRTYPESCVNIRTSELEPLPTQEIR